MNTTPKTDECIKMLGEAQRVFDPLRYNENGYFDKEGIINLQNRIKAILDYRLMPFGVISISDNADKDTIKNNPLLQHISNFDDFWFVMKNYQLITADDLRNEFWSICPDLESIPKFLDVINVKFDDVNYRYDTDIDKIKELYNGLNKHVELDEITLKEADRMFLNLQHCAERYNSVWGSIKDAYSIFRKMADPEQSNGNNQPEQPQPPHFTRYFTSDEQKMIFEGLKKAGFLPKDTNYNHFKFVFGGTAIPDNEKPFEPLKWIKTNSKTKGINPNKISLLDFLNLLGIPENEIKDKPLINSVFEIPNGEKFKANNYTDIIDRNNGNLITPIISEYHNELVEIVNQSKK
jgi:hypothetical protein